MDPTLRVILDGYRETALDMAHHLEQSLNDIDLKLDDDLRRVRLVAEAFVAAALKYEQKKEQAGRWDRPDSAEVAA